jgi:hypothetical protein
MNDQSERLPENSTFQQRFIKYEKILLELKSHGIFLKELSANGDPLLASILHITGFLGIFLLLKKS